MQRARAVLPFSVIVALVAITLLRGKGSSEIEWSDSFLVMDTMAEIHIWSDRDFGFGSVRDSILKEMVSIEKLLEMGRFKVTGSNTSNIPDEIERLTALSDSAYRLTKGFFDPTIGAVTRLWDFSPNAIPPHPDSLRNALTLVGFDRLISGELSEGVLLDFGGIAKGYACDRAIESLRRLGCSRAIINLGGDLSILGRRKDGKPWRIAIRHPRETHSFIGYLDVDQCAIATSGDYERFFIYQGKRYHHIIDPKDGMPGSRCQSVTVVAASAWLADAMATALFLMGPDMGSDLVDQLEGTDAVFVFAEGESVLVTDGLKGRFTRIDRK